MIRVAFYPSHQTHENPYFDLYHAALAKFDIETIDGSIDDRFLRDHQGAVQAFHIQWTPESIWRLRGNSRAARMWGVLGLIRFLRLARALKYRILWTVHDLEHHEGSDWIDRWAYRVLAGYTDLALCHSRWAEHEIARRYGLPPRRLLMIPHGNYDGVYPEPRPSEWVRHQWKVPVGKRLLLCFGFVRPYKGADLAVEAMSGLGDDYHLIVAGPPSVPEFIERLRRLATGQSSVLLHLQALSRQEIADLIGTSDCVLFPYRKITGSGALAAVLTFSRGVVVSDLPYFREIVSPEPLAAELFAPGDAQALAQAITRFFDVPVSLRHTAARRLADATAWEKVVAPVAKWLKLHCPAGDPEKMRSNSASSRGLI